MQHAVFWWARDWGRGYVFLSSRSRDQSYRLRLQQYVCLVLMFIFVSGNKQAVLVVVLLLLIVPGYHVCWRILFSVLTIIYVTAIPRWQKATQHRFSWSSSYSLPLQHSRCYGIAQFFSSSDRYGECGMSIPDESNQFCLRVNLSHKFLIMLGICKMC